MSIKAVIWDFGGVFTTSPFEAFNRYEVEHGLPTDFIRSINAANPDTNAWAQFERSDITPSQFDTEFAAEARAQGHNVPGADVIALLHGDLRPAMVRALEVCKGQFKTGCITNNVKPAEEGSEFWEAGKRAATMAPVFALFDHLIESYKAGVRKPDPRIYQMMCKALDVEPEACVYLDDLGVNCKPARALGMTTIKVVSGAQAITDLEKVVGLDLR